MNSGENLRARGFHCRASDFQIESIAGLVGRLHESHATGGQLGDFRSAKIRG